MNNLRLAKALVRVQFKGKNKKKSKRKTLKSVNRLEIEDIVTCKVAVHIMTPYRKREKHQKHNAVIYLFS